MLNEFIKLNGQIFEYTDRDYRQAEIKGSSRVLNGSLKVDYTTSYSRFLFNFDVEDRVLARLKKIYDLHDEIWLNDADNQRYKVVWSNEWNPQLIGYRDDITYHTLQIEFEGVSS